MHPAVKKSWEIGQELKMSTAELARHVGFSSSTYHYWLKGEKKPRKASVEKMQRFINRYEAGERFQPKPKAKLKNIPVKNIEQKDKRIIYEYIFYLEEKYGELHKADDNDPVLIKLRKEVGA